MFEDACSVVCSDCGEDPVAGELDVGFDDVLDALAAAVTAYKSGGKPCSLPKTKTPQYDPEYPQLRMEMVYWIPRGNP